MKKKLLIGIPIVLVVLYIVLRLVIAAAGSAPDNLGIKDGKLIPCPDSPNCISTFEDKTDEQHYMEAISFEGSTEEVMKKIDAAIEEMPLTNVIKSEGNYRYVEFKTFFWRFTDDVEVYFDEDEQLIHFRSASRLGHSDLGANRKRMTAFAELVNAK